MIVHEDGSTCKRDDKCYRKGHKFEVTNRFSVVNKLPEGEKFVSLITHNGSVLIASTKGVYIISDDNQLVPLEIIMEATQDGV